MQLCQLPPALNAYFFTSPPNRQVIDRHSVMRRLHIIILKEEIKMILTNTYLNNDPQTRLTHQAAIHRRCLLLLQALRIAA